MSVPMVTLRSGVQMPQVGLGTWPLRGEDGVQAVLSGLRAGYRLIDTAENYGNEDAVGTAVRKSGLPREEVFITTKFNKRWHSQNGVRQALTNSLGRLGLEYVDLFLIHWPNPQQGTFADAFAGMLQLQQEGLIRAAGVSNFKPRHLQVLLDQAMIPEVNQIQLDPQRPRWDIVEFLRQNGIITECWSPLGAGDGDLLRLPAIVAAAQAHDRSPAQVVLRWEVQHGYVTIPKSANPERQAQNLNIFDFELTSEEMTALDGLANPALPVSDSDVFGH